MTAIRYGIRLFLLAAASMVIQASKADARCYFLECAPGDTPAAPPPAPQRTAPPPAPSPVPSRVGLPPPTTPAERCTPADRALYCVSSVLPPQHGFTYGPDKLLDGRLDTAWVPAGALDGIGDWASVRLDPPGRVTGLFLMNGYRKNREIFLKNNRVRDFEVRTSSGWSASGQLADSDAFQTIPISDASRVTWVQLIVRSVYPGTKYHDTALSELRVQE